jgi:hypothetical protein
MQLQITWRVLAGSGQVIFYIYRYICFYSNFFPFQLLKTPKRYHA